MNVTTLGEKSCGAYVPPQFWPSAAMHTSD